MNLIESSVNPADWDPLWLYSQFLYGSLQFLKGFVQIVVYDDQIKIVVVSSLNPCTFIHRFLQVRVLSKSFKRKCFYHDAYLLAETPTQSEHEKQVGLYLLIFILILVLKNLYSIKKVITIYSHPSLSSFIHACIYEYSVSSVSLMYQGKFPN